MGIDGKLRKQAFGLPKGSQRILRPGHMKILEKIVIFAGGVHIDPLSQPDDTGRPILTAAGNLQDVPGKMPPAQGRIGPIGLHTGQGGHIHIPLVPNLTYKGVRLGAAVCPVKL
jgi:hypothetical protein